MDEIVKHINDTNASYRSINAGDAKNTDLFLDNEHYELFKEAGKYITVRFDKENLTKAILFIASILPRKYDNSSIHKKIPFSEIFVYEQLAILNAFFKIDGKPVSKRTQTWEARKDVLKKNGEIDNRFYFNGLLDNIRYEGLNGEEKTAKFSIRNYLAGGFSDIHIKKADDGVFDVWVSNTQVPYDDGKELPSTLEVDNTNSLYRPFITAIKSKPFLLLAGISGTGKSRIVRELARACWEKGSKEYEAQKPRNFEMVQVKPNWHDSSELIGYVSRIGADKDGNGVVFVAGDFLKFVARAWEEPDVPYFLCLDEMNLAPVEQYFAEYLSVIESRKADENGIITTDPILKMSDEKWYFPLMVQLTNDDTVRQRFQSDGICIPQNLIVVGTVNMDETTFSFSRKVLDRAMTIEMNKVDLHGGLNQRYEEIGKLGKAELIGNAVEGVDVYEAYKSVCDTAIDYLQRINDRMEGKPFKIAYRTRNEVLLYVVNNLPYNKDNDGNDIPEGFVIARALDEITSMKVLSRIEGDETKVSLDFLNGLETEIKNGLCAIYEGLFDKDGTGAAYSSVSIAKLEEMKNRLASGYTSFWS